MTCFKKPHHLLLLEALAPPIDQIKGSKFFGSALTLSQEKESSVYISRNNCATRGFFIMSTPLKNDERIKVSHTYCTSFKVTNSWFCSKMLFSLMRLLIWFSIGKFKLYSSREQLYGALSVYIFNCNGFLRFIDCNQ